MTAHILFTCLCNIHTYMYINDFSNISVPIFYQKLKLELTTCYSCYKKRIKPSFILAVKYS